MANSLIKEYKGLVKKAIKEGGVSYGVKQSVRLPYQKGLQVADGI